MQNTSWNCPISRLRATACLRGIEASDLKPAERLAGGWSAAPVARSASLNCLVRPWAASAPARRRLTASLPPACARSPAPLTQLAPMMIAKCSAASMRGMAGVAGEDWTALARAESRTRRRDAPRGNTGRARKSNFESTVSARLRGSADGSEIGYPLLLTASCDRLSRRTVLLCTGIQSALLLSCLGFVC